MPSFCSNVHQWHTCHECGKFARTLTNLVFIIYSLSALNNDDIIKTIAQHSSRHPRCKLRKLPCHMDSHCCHTQYVLHLLHVRHMQTAFHAFYYHDELFFCLTFCLHFLYTHYAHIWPFPVVFYRNNSYPHFIKNHKTFYQNIVDTSGMASYYRGSS